MFITLAELAAETGRSENWWMANWLRQHQRHGFPRRLPGLWAWPRAAVAAWARRGGAALPEPANDHEPANDGGLAAARSDLAAEYGLA